MILHIVSSKSSNGMNRAGLLIAVVVFLALAELRSFAAQPVFVGVAQSPDGVTLKWSSENNALYRIEYTDALSDNTVWKTFADQFPSQGTTTVWADVGDETAAPPIAPPYESPARFYRVAKTGSYASSFTVTIVNPPTGTVTDEISFGISTTSPTPLTGMKLFVDGIEIDDLSDPSASFVLNTCTLANGAHRLFVVAASESGKETTLGVNNKAMAFGTSAGVDVVFDNFITSFRAKDIWNGDTLIVRRYTANFADYADWTLTITNSFGQPVRTVSGTDFMLLFDWDGNNDAGQPVPNDFYAAVLSASASAQSPPLPLMGPPPAGGPPSMESSKSVQPVYSLSADRTFIEVYSPPFPPLPPGLKVKGTETLDWRVTRIPVKDYGRPKRATTLSKQSAAEEGGIAAAMNGQTTVLYRPGVFQRQRGTFGIAYQDHHPSWLDLGQNVNWPGPHNGINQNVLLGNEFITPRPYGPLRTVEGISSGFKRIMQRAAYYPKFIYKNDDLNGAAIRSQGNGGSNVFNNVNFGFLIGHGVNAVTPDFRPTAAGVKPTYYPIWKTGTSVYDWVSLAECDFGSQDLRWMAILACNMLADPNFDDMINKFVFPMNEDLHIMMSGATYIYMVGGFGRTFSGLMVGKETGDIVPIREAWFEAGRLTQHLGEPEQAITFRTVFWPDVGADTLISWGAPDPFFGYEYEDRQVFP